MEARVHAVGDHPRAVPHGRRWSGPSDPDGKEEADAVRSPEVEILPDDGFEEQTPLHRAIEDLRETDFELIDGEAVIVAGAAVGCRERPGQTMRPAVKEGLDVVRAQRIAGGLQGDRVGTGEKPVVERLEPNAFGGAAVASPIRGR
jgi:hypothetical protein